MLLASIGHFGVRSEAFWDYSDAEELEWRCFTWFFFKQQLSNTENLSLQEDYFEHWGTEAQF